MIFTKFVLTACLALCLVKADYNCENTVPSTSTDCTSGKNVPENNSCCYLEGIQNYANTKKCISLPKSAYNGNQYYIYQNKQFKITCSDNKTNNSNLPSCGPKDAESMADCSTASSFVNSCCFYKGSGSDDETPAGCYSLGTKFQGDTTWANMELECSAERLIFSLGLFALIIAMLF